MSCLSHPRSIVRRMSTDMTSLQALANLARRAVSAAQRVWADFDGEPLPDSRAGQEHARAQDYAVPGSSSLVFLAHNAAAFPLLIAAEQLEAWALLTEAKRWVFADVGPFRNAIEASARSIWLCDPDIGVEERIGRALADMKHTAEKLEPLQGRRWGREQQRWVTASAERIGIELPAHASTNALLKELLLGDKVEKNLGPKAWALGSAYSHGGFWTSFGQSREVIIDAENDVRRLEMAAREPQEAAKILHIALIAYGRAHSQRLMFYGMSTDAWVEAVSGLQEQLLSIKASAG
jgi:hypothetical protein